MSASMNSLLGAMLNSGATAATRSADEARVSSARAQSAKAEASGQFSQLLRGYDKPAESPTKPAAEASPAPASATAPPKPEGKTEMQRQEARSTAPKKAAEPPSKSIAEQAAAATSQAAAETSEAAVATAHETKSVDEGATDTKDAAASPDGVIAALPATPLPLALPMAALGSPGALGAPGTAKPPGSEIAPDDADQADDGKTSSKAATSTSTSTALGRTAHAAAEDVKARASDASAQNSAAQNSATDFAAALSDAVQAQPAALRSTEAGLRARSDGTAALDGIASAQTPQTALNPASADTSSPARVSVASPLYTPGFAPEMAARLSMLAADGVQTAQLHLNPADMGPVAVQIVVEGQQARIEFQADQADTRAVLERSLPDLAAALRDSGLTLSGGGVFQQFAGQDQSGAQARNEGNTPRRGGRDMGDALSALPLRAAPVARQTQGVVDLYA